MLTGATLNAVDDSGSTNEDTSISINVLSNDSGDGLSIVGVKGAGSSFASTDTTTEGASLSYSGNHVTYNPAGALDELLPGEVITDTFQYRVDSNKTGDDDETPQNATVTVTVTGINDYPTITFSSSVFSTSDPDITVDDDSDETAFNYSSSQKVVIADVDGPNGQDLIVTIEIQDLSGGDQPGVFNNQQSGFTSTNDENNPGVYTYTARANTASTQLQSLVFVPYPNLEAIGRSTVANFSISVIESDTSISNRSEVTADTGIEIVAVNHPPQIFVPSTAQFVFTRSTIEPFTGVLITENDLERVSNANVPQQISATIREVSTSDQRGELRNPTGVTNGFSQDSTDPNLYTIAQDDPDEVLSVLQGLVFHASEDFIDPPVETVFEIVITDEDSATATDTNTTVNTRSPETLSDITNTQSGQRVEDDTSIILFEDVVVTGGANRMVIRLKDLDNGGATLDATSPHKLVNLTKAGFVAESDGSYSYDGITSKMTENIRKLAFRPGENLAHPNDAPSGVNPPYPQTILGTIQFEIELYSGTSSLGTDDRTTVEIFPVNDLPRLAGLEPIDSIQDDETAQPFTLALVDDPDNASQQVIEATIDLETSYTAPVDVDAIGTLVGDFTLQGDSYTLTGTPSTIQSGLQGLVFKPSLNRMAVGRNETVTFVLTLDDQHGGVVTNGSATLIVTSVNDAPVFGGGVVKYDVTGAGAGLVSEIEVLDDNGEILFDENILDEATTITDVDRPEQELTLTIKIDDPEKGGFKTLYNRTGPTGGPYVLTPDDAGEYRFEESGNGTYTYVGKEDEIPSHAELEAALMGMVFEPDFGFPIPPGELGIPAQFTITIRDPQNEADQVKLDYLFVGTDRKSWIVNRSEDYDPDDQTLVDADKEGTLRHAIEQAGSNDFILIDLRDPDDDTLAAEFPVTIRLEQPLIIERNLSIFGPSADLLTISGDVTGDGSGDHRLFEIQARVFIEGLTLADGDHAVSGGAIWVGPNGDLTLQSCAIVNSAAGQWGGAIDAEDGELHLNQCLVSGNRTSDSLGQGGGAISLYTSKPCSFVNTTFSDNRQSGSGGFGGGALYIENSEIGWEFTIDVDHCTFRDNVDAAGNGSSIRAEAFNTWVWVRNTIVADGNGQNLGVEAGARIISLGGNVSDDSTQTIFSQGGEPYVVQLFFPHPNPALRFSQVGPDAPYDVVSLEETETEPILEPLEDNGGPTLTHAIPTDSPLIGYGLVSETAIDQRGVWRDPTPEPGAYEFDAFRELVINEVHYNPDENNDTVEDVGEEFVELFNTRTSDPLPDLTGFKLLFGDQVWHTFEAFTAGPLERGTGLVIGGSQAVGTGLPSGVLFQEANGGFPLDNRGGTISLVDPYGRVLHQVRFLGLFEPDLPAFEHQSLSRNPEFVGVLVPQNRIAFEGGPSTETSTPGTTVDGNVLTAGNSPPRAVDDFAVLFEDESGTLDVLGNDIEPDRFDVLQIVGLGADPENDTVIESAWGAYVEVVDQGQAVFYDPTTAPILQSIPEGEELVDFFTYTMIDYNTETQSLNPRSPTGDPVEEAENLERATGLVEVLVLGLNDVPTPADDDVSTSAALTTTEDDPLLINVASAILQNDDDPDWDDNSNTLLIAALHEPIAEDQPGGGTVLVPNETGRVEVTSLLGARVSLEIRFNRNQTRITYDPTTSEFLNSLSQQQGETADDVFFYSVVDRHGASALAMVTIRVTAVNDPPTANPDGPDSIIQGLVDSTDAYRTVEDAPISIPVTLVLANDTDPDTNDVLEVASVSGPSLYGATVQLNTATGNIFYNPAGPNSVLGELSRGEFILDSFSYQLTDSTGGTDEAEVHILVEGANDPPVAITDDYLTDEDTSLTMGTGGGLLQNDEEIDVNGSDPDDQLLIVDYDETSVNDALVTVLPDGSFTYNPTGLPQFDALLDDEIFDSFQYIASDGSLTIANPDFYTVAANSFENELLVLANDASLGAFGGAIEIVDFTQPDQGGTVALNQAGDAFIYQPAGNFNGFEAFSYLIRDELGAEDLAYVVIEVIEERVNGKLYANPDAYLIALGTSADLPVLANDGLVPGQALGLSVVEVGPPPSGMLGASPTLGELEILPDGVGLRFTPSPQRADNELVAFSYTISGGGSALAEAAVQLRMVDRTGAVVVNDDDFTVIRFSQQNLLDVLANDDYRPPVEGILSLNRVTATAAGMNAPVLGDGLSATTIGGGFVEVTEDGLAVLYTPPNPMPAGEFVDSFAYRAEDLGGGTGIGVVAVTVTPGGFVARDDFFTVGKNTAGNEFDVLANDVIYPATDPMALITEVTGPENPADPNKVGTLLINTSGKGLIYTPPRNVTEVTETFTYEIEDSEGRFASAQVHIRIERDGIFAMDDEFSVLMESGPSDLDVLANDSLILRLGELTIDAVTAPDQGGAVQIMTDPDTQRQWLRYAPPANFIGEETFSYKITDGIETRTAQVRILVTVGGLVANPDRYTVAQGSSENQLAVLLNDVLLPDIGEQLIITVTGTGINAPQNGGMVEVNAGGDALVYTPDPAFFGTEVFTYEISDDSLRRAQGLVVVTIEPRDAALDPQAHDDLFSVRRSSINNNLPVLANDDILATSGKSLSLIDVTEPSKGGTAQINGKAILYSPSQGFVGTETFTYQFGDGQGGTGTALVKVVVGNEQAQDDIFAVVSPDIGGVAQTFVLDVLANDDPNPASRDLLTIVDAAVKHGTVEISPDGDALLYTPPVGHFEPDFLSYWLEDPLDEAPGDFSARVAVLVYQEDSDLTEGTVNITVTGVNDVPRIGGIPNTGDGETLTVYHLLSLDPFASIDVFDPDGYGSQELTVIITQSDPNQGYLTNLGGFVYLGNGVYSFTGTSEEVSEALQNLVFVPTTDGRITVGESESTSFTLSIDDGVADPVLIEGITIEAIHAQVTKLASVDGPNNDNFGQPVATSEDIIAIGVPYGDNADGVRTGTVFIYERTGDDLYREWSLATVLSPPDGETGNQFGFSVGFDGQSGILVVGAPFHKSNGQDTGSAYLFGRDQGGEGQWGLITRLDPVNGSSGDHFGNSVAVDGSSLAVGARLDRENGTAAGAVYLYDRDQNGPDAWGLVTKLVSADGRGGDEFGYSVALSGDQLAVGAPYDDDGGSSSGSVYVYGRDQGGTAPWSLQRKLQGSDTRRNDQFGFSVALDSGLLIAGALYDDVSGNASGSAYAFEYQYDDQADTWSWNQIHKFIPESGERNDEFGHSVAVSRDVVVIGSRFDDVRAVNAGAAYVYKRDHDPANRGIPTPDSWGLVEKLVSVDGDITDHFGYSVDIEDDTIVVGSSFDGQGKEVDRTYVFRIKFNNGPIQSLEIEDQVVVRGVPFEFSLAPDTFADPDSEDGELVYSASSADGGELPGWLLFDPASLTFSGLAGNFDVGSFQIRVTATDSDGATADAVFSIEVIVDPPVEASQGLGLTGPQQAWSLSYFDRASLDAIVEEPVIWGAHADPDGDGRINLYEYAFGTDPQEAGAEGVLDIFRDSQGLLFLTYSARFNDPRLRFELQVSTDGTNWTSGEAWISERGAQPIDAEHEQVTLLVEVPESAPEAMNFRILVRY
jgi:VCBS repeat-containing protein